jgi:hypothetical protein
VGRALRALPECGWWGSLRSTHPTYVPEVAQLSWGGVTVSLMTVHSGLRVWLRFAARALSLFRKFGRVASLGNPTAEAGRLGVGGPISTGIYSGSARPRDQAISAVNRDCPIGGVGL